MKIFGFALVSPFIAWFITQAVGQIIYREKLSKKEKLSKYEHDALNSMFALLILAIVGLGIILFTL